MGERKNLQVIVTGVVLKVSDLGTYLIGTQPFLDLVAKE